MKYFLIILGVCSIFISSASAQTQQQVTNSANLIVMTDTEGIKQELTIPVNKLLFYVNPHIDQTGKVISLDVKLNHSLDELYTKIGFPQKSENVVFIYPIFTQGAYANGGFYDFYNKKCDTRCLTIPIPHDFHGIYSSSIGGAFILRLLNYSYITDTAVDKNPDILKRYQTVIVLHNEYVTQKEFDAITSHPHVVYLYPNALYAQVESNYTSDTITLVKGHEYPTQDIKNAFGWRYDNSKEEYDVRCDNWNLNQANNGKILNCYPDYRILYDQELLKTIKDSVTEQVPELGASSVLILAIAFISILGLSKLRSSQIKTTI